MTTPRRRFRLFLSLLLASAITSGSRIQAQPQPARPFDQWGGVTSDRVVVRLKADAFERWGHRRAEAAAEPNALGRTSRRFRNVAGNWGATKLRRSYEQAFRNPGLARQFGLDRTFVLEVPSGTDTVRLAAALAALNDEVEMAGPDEIGGVAGEPVIPADSQFAMEWGLHNTGQFINTATGTVDADIDAPEAWAIHTGLGDQQVVVAVIDSGISSHPEFGNNLGPESTGRILPGWNTVLNSGATADLIDNCGTTGHGTHVAGTIGAAGGPSCGGGTSDTGKSCETAADCAVGCLGGINGGRPCASEEDCPGSFCGSPTCAAIGVAGVSWGVYLLPVKVMTGCGGTSSDLVEGIIWAADNGADVINMSIQYNLMQQISITNVQNAVNYAHAQGVLLVAATGNNDGCSNGLPPTHDTVCYPARMPNVVAVSATDNNDLFGTFSNYGAEVDVAAPGKDVRSTLLNGSYGYMFGTSMATPHVSGLAALIKSYVPELTNDELEAIITSTAEDRGTAGWDNRFGYGRINAHQALLAAALWPGIIESSPPDAAIDAGQPMDRVTLEPQGWSRIDVRFPRDAAGVATSDFVIEQTVAGSAPGILAIEPLEPDLVRVVLDRPIDPLAWTTLTHVATGSVVRLGFLPGDADADAFTSPADILALIDSLNGVTPRPEWSTDIDRSGLSAPADIITIIDLLNGAAPFPVYNGNSLPPIP